MRKIQVIGLPGVGKTTAIKKFLKLFPTQDIVYLDISNFSGRNREDLFAGAIKTIKKHVIAESACGVNVPSLVVKLSLPVEKIVNNLRKRGDEVDIEYLSYLERLTIPPHLTIKDVEALPSILADLILFD